ncbi:MAG: methyltransferase, partial [Actinomycetota bacterium]|nr:methyltransferase [Actinomycetota bacterium]
NGWAFARENGVLWRVADQATYERDGFWLDLHWGLQVGHLPGRVLAPVERALWEGARSGPSGMVEPDPESLLVFLAAHVVGHRFERPQWQENVTACAALVEDWPKVWRIARRSRVETAVRKALEGGVPQEITPVLDGPRGRVVWALTWVARGHFLPRQIRGAVREALALRREGFGLTGWTRPRIVSFDDRKVVVPRGVFPPQSVSLPLLEMALDAIATRAAPIVVEVGTGSGAIALSLGARRPDATIYATDISYRALSAARLNRRRLEVRNVRFCRGDLLEPLPPMLKGRTALILGNIPFVPPNEAPRFAYLAPTVAIRGPSVDGLALLRDLALQASALLEPGGRLIFQLAEWQWDPFAEFVASLGYRVVEPDLGIPSFGVAEWKGAEQ